MARLSIFFMNKILFAISVLLIACFSTKVRAQQIVVNKYSAVQSFDDCNNRIKVDNPDDFNVGDTILIIQMQGAIVDSSNTTTFGDTLAYYGAGNYEYNLIQTKKDDVLGLKYQVKRTYQWNRGKVQIVRVPSYQNYTVNTELSCAPWNGTTGGVLAIIVNNTLTLNQDINVSGKGFRGGFASTLTATSCNRTDYYYDGTSNLGARKGEGIAFLLEDKMYGRGKMANGGGGGNNNKSGGGGGANGGKGGDGGNQYQATICVDPLISDIGGKGGLNLRYTNPLNKIFMGGGGGAGHGSLNTPKSGGNGGGIAIIMAHEIIGNNFSVSANGMNGPECTAPGANCEDDGMGGGGGGGAILIKADTIKNLLKLNAKGGKGADVYSSITVNSTFQPGPGGGGGGGTIWFASGATPAGVTQDVSGGLNGQLPQWPNNAANGAKPGQTGLVVYNSPLTFPKVADTFKIKNNINFKDSTVSCATVAFINLTFPTTNVYSYWWDFGDGDTSYSASPTHTYGSGGTYTIRLAVVDNTGCTDTLVRNIVINSLNYGISDTLLSCKTIRFDASKITGPDAVYFHWDYGDNDTGVGNPSTHVYQNGGNYTVILTTTDSSGCTDTTHHQIYVDDVVVGFTVDDDTVCQGQVLNFTSTTTANTLYNAWNFGDGQLDSTQNPVHIYPNTNTYVVTLIGENEIGCLDTAVKTIVVDSISPVSYVASDTVLCEGQGIVLNGEYIKDNATGISWDLGDGFTAANVDPVNHAYDTSGNFNVTLTVSFRACPDVTASKEININPFPALNLGPDTTMCPNGPGIVLVDNINISNPRALWKWNTGDSTSSITVRHPGVYTAQVNLEGCVTSDSVEVFKDCYIDIPNAFSPNNDGQNDYFLPRQLLSKSITAFEMTVYDRWGQEVFKTNRTDGRGWDGKLNGVDQPFGVYIYRINVTFGSGAAETYTGNVTLLR